MRIIKSASLMQATTKRLRLNKKTIGFVPTMGAFHEGHLSLMRKARRENDIVVCSIFVNPKQFAAGEDFTHYPRSFNQDKSFAQKEKVDIIFHPSEKEMYPSGFLTTIDVAQITETLCGKSRPGHFRGVATVVGKLLNIINPDCLYLGQKDAQQTIIIQRMIRDLNFPTKVKICPTIRESDGLAMSSRNIMLTPKDRREAPILFQSLTKAKRLIQAGERNIQKITQIMGDHITAHSSGKIDYIECVDADTLKPLKTISQKMLLALAVRFKGVRLIDNTIVNIR